MVPQVLGVWFYAGWLSGVQRLTPLRLDMQDLAGTCQMLSELRSGQKTGRFPGDDVRLFASLGWPPELEATLEKIDLLASTPSGAFTIRESLATPGLLALFLPAAEETPSDAPALETLVTWSLVVTPTDAPELMANAQQRQGIVRFLLDCCRPLVALAPTHEFDGRPVAAAAFSRAVYLAAALELEAQFVGQALFEPAGIPRDIAG